MSSLLLCFLVSFICRPSEIGGVPVFERQLYQSALNETSPQGTFVTKVQATARQNPKPIVYSLEYDKGWFQIDNSSGVITVARTLDREGTGSLLDFQAVAKAGNQKGTAYVWCTIRDINDNYPQFENLPYRFNISEDTKVGEEIFRVSASDKDSSDHHNNAVFFRIVGGNTDGTFKIDGGTGKIMLDKPVDFDGSTRQYSLNVTATDQYGAPTGNQNWTVVNIGVTDADDLPAEFSQYLYEVLIDVDTPQGGEIIRVHAEDQDSMKASVSYVIYPASDPEESFKINNATGVITVNRNLSQKSYPLIVTAKSTNQPDAFALVMINVGSMPNRTFVASVIENEENTTVFDLTNLEKYFNISDPIFVIHRGNEGGEFFVNETSKELRVGAQGLDREEHDKYTLVMELFKGGKSKGFAMINVNVVDVNDNTPRFKNLASVSVPETTPEGSVVLTVTALDRDAGLSGSVVYDMIAGNERALFALNNKSGELSLVKQLDYEAAAQYVLNVSASDMGEPGRRAFSGVIINVIDANDNSPVLQARIIQVSLAEGTSSGSFVAQCNASDADAAANARITYRLVEGAVNRFSIDNITGVITTSESFDKETEPEEYTLVVNAQDNGQHPRSDVGFVVVHITNINEHSPVFSPTSYVGGVYKDTTYYSLVTTVKASDADSDSQSAITFELVNGNGLGFFHVEPDTGHVRVATSLADKDGSKFSLEVSASDGGKKAATNAIVNIFVLRDEDSLVIKAGVVPEEITKGRQKFLEMIKTITGGDAFIKYLQEENGENATLVILHAVRGNDVMSGFDITRALSDNEELLKTTYKLFNILWYRPPDGPPSAEARTGTEDELSAVVGAMICFGVIIGVGAMFIMIILTMRKRSGKSPFKKKRHPRVTFNDKLFFIDPVQPAVTSNHVESAQEAQEVIVHIPAEDDNSSEGSDDGSHNVVSFLNFGYGSRLAAMSEKDPEEFDDMDHNTFFPPPPKGPPPKPPDSDEENSDSISMGSRSDYENEVNVHLEKYNPDDVADVSGILLSHSPSDSTTESTDQLVTGYPNVMFPNGGSFLRSFSLNEATTEL